uniref:Uncharacterized protein n=1 Tax=Triticum urartu TaxID=4572 RepID=A0A8R7TBD4_TRIUA
SEFIPEVVPAEARRHGDQGQRHDEDDPGADEELQVAERAGAGEVGHQEGHDVERDEDLEGLDPGQAAQVLAAQQQDEGERERQGGRVGVVEDPAPRRAHEVKG